MDSLSAILIAAAFAGTLGVVGVREHKALRGARRQLLLDCADVLEKSELRLGGDDFPSLSGTHRGRPVRAELIPDTMTIRRLPQLWLSVTMLEPMPIGGGFAVLVRPSGNDFYSLTETFDLMLTPHAALPWEVLARGENGRSEALLTALGPFLGRILSDVKVKEIAVTRKGLRIIRQAGEGRRGEHLLLRQAIFDNAEVPAGELQRLLGLLDEIAAAVRAATHQDVAA